MQVKRLELINVRAFEHAVFEFQPGMNLLVGVNGAGKSTVLDVLRIMFSRSLLQLTPSIDPKQSLTLNDRRIDWEGEIVRNFQVELQMLENGFPIKQVFKNKKYTLAPSSQILMNELPSIQNSLAVFYSTRRSIPSGSTEGSGVFSQKFTRRPNSPQNELHQRDLAYAGALKHRHLQLSTFAIWWTAQEAIGYERTDLPVVIDDIVNAVTSFLPEYSYISVSGESIKDLQLWLDKGSAFISIRQLSDGERSVIALVIDLARRLTLANPDLDNPLREGKAVVLIDEIDLHLHPAWQRTICERLTNTFPKCQFIATTHSPQIIGEIKPDNITIIEDGNTMRPQQSLGMDTNWILEYIMGVPRRKEVVQQKLREVEQLIENDKYDEALKKLEVMRNAFGDFPELAALQAHIEMINFLADDMEAEEE